MAILTWDKQNLCDSVLTARTFIVLTEPQLSFNQAWLITHRNVFQFYVRTCYDAHIALAEVPGMAGNTSYGVAIGAGNNEKIIIYKDLESKEIEEERTATPTLSCEEYRVSVKLLHQNLLHLTCKPFKSQHAVFWFTSVIYTT